MKPEPDAMPQLVYMKAVLTLIGVFLLLSSCQQSQESSNEQPGDAKDLETSFNEAPSWSKSAIWYQIFVETFRNGDTSNDPTPLDIEGSYPGIVPENWSVTQWGHDWFAPDPYFSELNGKDDWNGYPITEFHQKVQLRRYGGDIQGVIDKVDYLDSLGVTAIYFNPLNDAPSKHKYDARNWRHIDRNFGPSPERDKKTIEGEVADDPSTWEMTSADSLFLFLIKEFHNRGMRVIMDYSWNHTGAEFWAIDDIRKNGQESKFNDWFWVEKHDDPETSENELHYKGWVGLKSLPEIKEDVEYESSVVAAYEGNIESENAKSHIFNITKRWLDPNGDGNTSDGVDGFRLDVAGEIGLGFWREYREVVRSVNPEAYLVGEIWWEEWPDKLLDPKPFLEGDVFDAVMNYRWYRAARYFFNQAPDKIPVSEFVDSLNSFKSNLRYQNTMAMMNVAASHDVPRLSTSIFNKNKYKVGTNPFGKGEYKIHKPDEDAYQTVKLLLIQQFTYLGAPHIWAGDEMGMWGGDDPNNRKPLIWNDLEFETETTHPMGLDRPADEVKFNESLFQFYRQLIRLRNENNVLIDGEFEFVIVDDENEILAYHSFNNSVEVLSVFNTSNQSRTVLVPVKFYGTYNSILSEQSFEPSSDDKIEVPIEPRHALVLRSN